VFVGSVLSLLTSISNFSCRKFSRYDLLIHHWMVSFVHFTTYQSCKIRIQLEKSCTCSATLIYSELQTPDHLETVILTKTSGIYWSKIWITHVIVCNFLLLQKSGNLLARTFYGPGFGVSRYECFRFWTSLLLRGAGTGESGIFVSLHKIALGAKSPADVT
jgi:hypothetical protein